MISKRKWLHTTVCSPDTGNTSIVINIHAINFRIHHPSTETIQVSVGETTAVWISRQPELGRSDGGVYRYIYPKSVYFEFFMWLFCLLDPGQMEIAMTKN